MIVVTGASGFIGSHLCGVLASRGRAYTPVSRKDARGTVAVGEIDGGTDWSAVLDGATAVVHLAAHVHVRGREAAADFHRVNVEGTINLARQAAVAGVTRFVFVSSIAVNGNHTPPGRPFTEETPPAPHDAYGQSKHEAEIALRALEARSGFAATIIRPPLVYGREAPANFRMLLKAVARGLPLPLGSVQNLRSFVSVGNLCDLIVRCLDHPSAAGQTFLAADGEDLSTPDLVRRISVAMGRRPRLVPFPPGLIAGVAALAGRQSLAHSLLSSLQIDISKARGILGWTPPQRVDDAIAEAVAGYRDR